MGRERRASRIRSPLLVEGRLGMMLMVVLDGEERELDYVLMLTENDDAAVERAQLSATLCQFALLVCMLVLWKLCMSLEDVGESVRIMVDDCASLLPLGRARDPYGRCIAL